MIEDNRYMIKIYASLLMGGRSGWPKFGGVGRFGWEYWSGVQLSSFVH